MMITLNLQVAFPFLTEPNHTGEHSFNAILFLGRAQSAQGPSSGQSNPPPQCFNVLLRGDSCNGKMGKRYLRISTGRWVRGISEYLQERWVRSISEYLQIPIFLGITKVSKKEIKGLRPSCHELDYSCDFEPVMLMLTIPRVVG